MLEFSGSEESAKELLARLERHGIAPVPAMLPVPMGGGTIILTVEVPDGLRLDSLEGFPELVGVFGAPAIGPMDDGHSTGEGDS